MVMGSLGLYLNETLTSLTASLRALLLASFIDIWMSVPAWLSRICSKFPLGLGGMVLGGFSGLSGGVGFRVRVGGGGCWSAICRLCIVWVFVGGYNASLSSLFT